MANSKNIVKIKEVNNNIVFNQIKIENYEEEIKTAQKDLQDQLKYLKSLIEKASKITQQGRRKNTLEGLREEVKEAKEDSKLVIADYKKSISEYKRYLKSDLNKLNKLTK